jgi:hypothetical protein
MHDCERSAGPGSAGPPECAAAEQRDEPDKRSAVVVRTAPASSACRLSRCWADTPDLTAGEE